MQVFKSSKLTMYLNFKLKNKSLNLKKNEWNDILKVFEKKMNFDFLSSSENKKILKNKAHEISFSVEICGEKKIQSLNSKFRNKNKVTDVLSFAFYESKSDLLSSLPIFNLGDIFICLNQAKRQAKKFELSLKNEIVHLLIHGFLHLLGQDHELSVKKEKQMQIEEAKYSKDIFEKIKF